MAHKLSFLPFSFSGTWVWFLAPMAGRSQLPVRDSTSSSGLHRDPHTRGTHKDKHTHKDKWWSICLVGLKFWVRFPAPHDTIAQEITAMKCLLKDDWLNICELQFTTIQKIWSAPVLWGKENSTHNHYAKRNKLLIKVSSTASLMLKAE